VTLRIDIRRALAIYPRGAFIQWDLEGVTEVGTYTFDVYRGESSTGPWTTLVLGATGITNYFDRLPVTVTPGDVPPNQLSLARSLYYRVVATPPSGSSNAVEVVTALEPELEGYQQRLKRKLLRDQTMVLRKLSGVEVAVLKRKHWGVRCAKCYDKYTKETVRGNCTTCYGTGYDGGYHTPVITLARPNHVQLQTQTTPQGKVDVAQTRLVILDVPEVQKDDVLVNLQDNHRYLVQLVDHSELKTSLVYQTLMVSELSRSSIEYRVLVDKTRTPPLF
jgi:hypothetical protein